MFQNDTNSCPEVAVQTTYGGVLLWQLLVQGYYILDNVSGDVWELLKCREESLLDSASCFWAALETLRTTVGTYRPYIADYKKQVYDYGVGIIGDWKCCVGSQSCADDNAKRTEPQFIDRNLFRSAKKSKETAAKDWPKPLPTIPPSPPTMPPQSKQTLGSVLIRAKLFGIDFMWIEIDLTNLFMNP